jgi:uncharacterized protein (DUF305 family)
MIWRDENGDLSDAATAHVLRLVLWSLAGCLLLGASVFGARAVFGIGAPPRALSAVDVGFLQDMIDHHEQAIEIANAYTKVNPTGGAQAYASEVAYFQRVEINRMKRWLAGGKSEPGAPDRKAMAWMGMATTVTEMPGMQTAERRATLAASSGKAADRLFFDMMSDHHAGGVHMAEYEAARGSNRDVKAFARIMAKGQRVEIAEYNQAIVRLGL